MTPTNAIHYARIKVREGAALLSDIWRDPLERLSITGALVTGLCGTAGVAIMVAGLMGNMPVYPLPLVWWFHGPGFLLCAWLSYRNIHIHVWLHQRRLADRLMGGHWDDDDPFKGTPYENKP